MGPWEEWTQRSFPRAWGLYADGAARAGQVRAWAGELGEMGSERGLWVIFDVVVGTLGWLVFGTAWTGVKAGCRRALQLAIILVVCIAAHYVWALCWPVISLLVTITMALVWAVRKLVRLCGTGVYYVQRLVGGTPEACDADYYGPGVGRTPETSELRQFKPPASGEKWVVLKRDGMVAVLRVGPEAHPIKSSGMFLSVDADSLRGDQRLLHQLGGYDRVHLCRHAVCAEEGQHFQTYGLAKRFDPERFQLKQACEGAKGAGRAHWGFASTTKKRLADFGSESEQEAEPCEASCVRWSGTTGEERLSEGPCTASAVGSTDVLFEDQFQGRTSLRLCPLHSSKYLSSRYMHKCGFDGCSRLGHATTKGVRVCAENEGEMRPQRSSRSRSRYRSEVVAEAEGAEKKDDLQDVKGLLAEIRNALPGPAAPSSTPEPSRRRASRSPGNTPKSTIHRNLAKIGLLDSPGTDEDGITYLEEFFDLYAESKGMETGEAAVRRTLADRHRMSVAEITQHLVDQGVKEQAKGQRGLTRFLTIWRRELEVAEVPDFPSRRAAEADGKTSDWSVVSSRAATPRGREPFPAAAAPAAAVAQVVHKPGAPRLIEAPGIYGKQTQYRKAGAGAEPDPMLQVAKALQSQTQELAALVKGQVDNGAHPAGTIRGLGRLSGDLVFLLRACGQYDVRVCPGEVGSALAQALLSAQVGASTKLRGLGFRQKMTQRLAVGLAGPFWGTQERYSRLTSSP